MIRNKLLWRSVAGTLVAGIMLAIFFFCVIPIGGKQLGSTYGYFNGLSPASVNDQVHIVQLLSGPKKGIVTLESVQVDDYEGMELLGIKLYRGRSSDIPHTGEIPPGIATNLHPISGSRLLPNTEEATDYIVITFRLAGDEPRGPFIQRINYKWFGFPFMLTFHQK